MTDQPLKIGDRARLARNHAKHGIVGRISKTHLTVAVTTGQSKGDWLVYPVEWWEKVT